MRVLIISKYATPKLYPRHFRLGEELVKNGFEVVLVCSTSNVVGKADVPNFVGLTKKESINGVEIIWFKGPKITNRGISRILSWIIFELQCLVLIFKRFDVVYTSSLSLLSVYNGFIHKYLFNRTWILEIRDVWPITPIVAGGISKENFGIKFLFFTERLGYVHSDVLIGTMPNLSKRVKEELGIARDVFFLPQGVDIDLFTSDSLEVSSQFKDMYLPRDKFIVGYIGTMNVNNPLDELCELIETLPVDLRTKYWFIFLGSGELKEGLKKRLDSFENVVFPDPVDKKYIASILRHVDVGFDSIASGLAVYGLSRNKWIDYFFNGCPVVCVHEGHRSMINEADFGIYVNYKDIQSLQIAFEYYRVLDEEQMAELKKKSREYLLSQHSFSKLAHKLISWI